VNYSAILEQSQKMANGEIPNPQSDFKRRAHPQGQLLLLSRDLWGWQGETKAPPPAAEGKHNEWTSNKQATGMRSWPATVDLLTIPCYHSHQPVESGGQFDVLPADSERKEHL